MKLAAGFFILASALPLWATWNYDYNPQPGVPNLGSLDSNTFMQNGTAVFGSPGSGQPNALIGAGASTSGSLIEKNTIYGTSEYEILSVLRIQGNGGNFVQYVRSKPTSLNTSTPSGPFFTVELNNPTFTAAGCMAGLSFWQSDGTNATLKASSQVPCYDHMQIRTVVITQPSGPAYVWTMINGLVYSAYCDIATGNPGIGLWDTPANSGIERVQIGPRSLTAPAIIDRNSIGTSSFPDRVDMHWTDPLDITGVGIFIHAVVRDGVYKDSGFNLNDYTDNTGVSPGQTYTYQIVSTSFHGISSSPVTFTVTTPGAGSVDPRRVGLKPNGSYWGALGENLDNLSGNLNFSVPLLQAKARGGWGVTFALSYNSQMWRKDSGGTWLMGQDVGYGMGWRLMAGSITPAFNNQTFVVDHYTFTDSSGAEYRLDVNNGNVWTSKESIYVTFDANTDKLWFQNGSFWYMGCVSGGEEQDAGTRYPSLMQDKNGNQILAFYDAGAGTNYYNSSARLTGIADIRSTSTYSFHYSSVSRTDGLSDVIPHLTSIRANVQTGESYFFYRASGVTLTSPWGDSYGATDVLQQVVGAANPDNASDQYAPNRTYAFLYDAAVQMTRAALPPGGHLRWEYVAATYSNNRVEMEVVNRYLAQDAPGQGTGAETAYHISHEAVPGTVHTTTNLVDPTNAAKVWTFTAAAAPAWQIGLLASFQKKQTLGASGSLENNNVTWALTPTSNNPFVAGVVTQADGMQTSKTTQNLDQYGNVKGNAIWDYPATNTLADRQYLYNYAHEADGGYAYWYIRSAMTSKTVVDGNGQNAQDLSFISYDAGCSSFNVSAPVDVSHAALHDAANRNDHLANVSQVAIPGSGRTCNWYDAAGNVYITEGPGRPQQQVSYATDSNYSAPSTIRMNQDQQSLSSFTYTPWLGVSSYSGPNGSNGSFLYDNYAQPTRAILTTGAQVQLQNYPGATYPQYFPNSSNGYPWAQLSYVDGHYTRKTFDGLGRTIREERGPTGANSVGTPTSVVDTQYGSCACSPTGKMIRQSQPYAPGGTVYWTTYTYDGMGRTVTVTGPDGSSQTKVTYNATAPGAAAPPALGSSVTTVDPKGNWKIVTTDGFGNVARVTEPNPAGGAPYITQYLYDRIDHLTLVSMPRNGYTQTRSFVYDPVSFKLMNETHPETGMTKYEYHPGPHSELRLWIKTDAKNQQTKIEDGDYDVYGRPVRMKFLAPVAANAWAEDPCQQVTYTYDNYPATAGSNLSNGFGRVTTTQVGPGDATAACKVNAGPADGSRTNQNFLQAFGYTSAGQIALKRLQFSQIVTPASGMAPPPTVTTWDTKYNYDDEGFQNSVTYPMGQTHQIGLDFMKRPYSLTYQKPGVSVPGPFIQSVGYNAADQMTEMIWADNGGGVQDPDAYSYGVTYERRTYNQTNQLTRIYAFPANQAATVDLNYQYPAGQNNGQISSVTSGTDGNFNATYTYDSLKRLTALGGAKIQNYSYDGWGNLYSKTGDGSTFTVNIDSGTNRPYGGGICYDLNGNLLSTVSQCAPEYVYDMKNRLVKVAVSSNGMTDVSGHVDLSAELYFYTADNKRVTTVRPNGNLAQVFYVYGAKERNRGYLHHSDFWAGPGLRSPGAAGCEVCRAHDPAELCPCLGGSPGFRDR